MCIFPLGPFLASMTYNVLLIMACVFFAFKGRKLPDNYNESRFVSFCVYSTIIIWLAFIPSYFTVESARLEVMFLSLQVIANASLILFCIYVPKIYALYIVKKNNLNLSEARCHAHVSPMKFIESASWNEVPHIITTGTGTNQLVLETIVGSTIMEEQEPDEASVHSSCSVCSTERKSQAIREEHKNYACDSMLHLRVPSAGKRLHPLEGVL